MKLRYSLERELGAAPWKEMKIELRHFIAQGHGLHPAA